MTLSRKSLLLRAFQDQNGQVLPFMALLIVLFLGMAGITVDLGHAFICYRELQSSTDAAALAGALALSSSTATTASVQAVAKAYSSSSSGVNANPNLPSPTITTTLKCLGTIGIPCTASATGFNTVQVQQTTTVPTYFIRALGALGVKAAKVVNLSTFSTAAMRGATNAQYNVAVVLDTTASMASADTDASCGSTRIACALTGMQTLLQSLSPCTASSTSQSCAPFDQVSLFTFPNVSASTAQNDTTCNSKSPTILPYSAPTPGATWSAPSGSNATYQITDYLSNYSSTNKSGGALNTSSALAVASGVSGISKCTGLQTPGGQGTYYAGAIYAALSSLAAKQAANPGSQNALIILSDGDASTGNISGTLTKNRTYPSLSNQCQQGITAAKTAPSGTTVYTIAYGASSSGCSTDSGISPCVAMQQMASAPEDFYSDATASQNKGQCTSAKNPSLSLAGIFKQLTTQFTVARLIPDNTQ